MRKYDFDDDFPSIAASETTAVDTGKMRERIRQKERERIVIQRQKMECEERRERACERMVTRREMRHRYTDIPRLPQSHKQGPNMPVFEMYQARLTEGAHVDVKPTSDWPASYEAPFSRPKEPSFASTIKRRISLHHKKEEEPSRVFAGRHRRRVDDSIMEDWKESRRRRSTTSGRSHTSENPGCVGFLTSLFSRSDKNSVVGAPSFTCTTITEDPQKRAEELRYISKLAYDDFMHSPSNRPSPAARVFSKLRRS